MRRMGEAKKKKGEIQKKISPIAPIHPAFLFGRLLKSTFIRVSASTIVDANTLSIFLFKLLASTICGR
jgi:hypothetical protein